MAETDSVDEILTFTRQQQYEFVRELGQGACGKTLLLRDASIDDFFVCKKFSPVQDNDRESLYTGFIREIKLLRNLLHPNVVRVFNQYLYPERLTGYLFMEFVDGVDIGDYLSSHPDRANDVFLQVIRGFSYIQKSAVLHRDIRKGNILVNKDGLVKIIDFGFGKRIESKDDFEKSLSINWCGEFPDEFAQGRYDFATEVYFVGRLFERLIKDRAISDFEYIAVLRDMCQVDPLRRINGFSNVILETGRSKATTTTKIEAFSEEYRYMYQEFSDAAFRQLNHLYTGAKIEANVEKMERRLSEVYASCMLEVEVPDARLVLNCLIDGDYSYRQRGFSVSCLKKFLDLLAVLRIEQKRVVSVNLQTKLSAVGMIDHSDDDIPF